MINIFYKGAYRDLAQQQAQDENPGPLAEQQLRDPLLREGGARLLLRP
jgi:hypothetical protein